MDFAIAAGCAGINIAGAAWSAQTLPANFRPFAAPAAPGLPTLRLTTAPGIIPEGLKPLSSSVNDLGQALLFDLGHEWLVALVPTPGEAPRTMTMRKDFTEATVALRRDDPFHDFVVDSMGRIFFSQSAAARGALMLHASAVVDPDGGAFLLMGESGTGKSTHSRLWLEAFPGTELLNDDCPLVYPEADGTFRAAGTPWSGKTPCYRRASAPLRGAARLRQAPENRFTPLSGIEAFVEFIPGMSVMTADRPLYARATTTALDLLARTPFGVLACLPNPEAAQLLRASFGNDR